MDTLHFQTETIKSNCYETLTLDFSIEDINDAIYNIGDGFEVLVTETYRVKPGTQVKDIKSITIDFSTLETNRIAPGI